MLDSFPTLSSLGVGSRSLHSQKLNYGFFVQVSQESESHSNQSDYIKKDDSSTAIYSRRYKVKSNVFESSDVSPFAPKSNIFGPVHFINKLLESWELENSDALSLLGFEEQDFDFINDVLDGKRQIRGRDFKDRISNLLSIRTSLWIFFQDIQVENEWLREPQDMLDGQIPMSLLLEGSLENLVLVREYVDTVTGM